MFKKIWFQLHWFIGITAGTLLMTIGVTGAILAFREEIMDALSPGVMHVQVRQQATLTPQQLLDKLRAVEPARRVTTLTLTAEPGASARVVFAPPPGVRRGEARYADPYTGALLPPVTGAEFFEFIERFHRWLLLPTEIGKIVLGTLALALLVLALSGLYLRWPRRPLSLRAWLRLDFQLQGRSFLWNLHSVIGTWSLVMYVLFSITGAYWALDWFKDGMNTLAGESRRPAMQRGEGKKKPPAEDATALELTQAWNSFLAKAPDYRSAQLRLPEQGSQPVQIFFLDHAAPHERARSRMVVLPQSGEIRQLERYEDKSDGGKLIAAIYPLHMGTYFGLPGRIIMAIASLMMPLFGITGWMLYLDRRRKKAALRAERASLDGTSPAPEGEPVLVAYASQTGQAERIALHTAAGLRRSGIAVQLQSLAQSTPESLRHHRRILFIASTFGEGDAPDSARGFEKRLRQAAGQSLAHAQYAILALGDRHYAQFCGFGHTLDHGLRQCGAKPLFPLVEVDRMAGVALRKWETELAAHGLQASVSELLPTTAPAWQQWKLTRRVLMNPGSQGAPLYHVEIQPQDGSLPDWQAGALVEILPRHAPDRVALLLQRLQLDGSAMVSHQGRQKTPADALACSVLPPHPAREAQALADQLQPLAARSYSVASVPQDGAVHLLVRQVQHEDGLGLASGWLTEFAPIDAAIELRLVENAGFAPVAAGTPAIFIGNGSGLAGLRGHLRARVLHGETQSRNWLLFGERNERYDFLYADEWLDWLEHGRLARLDLAFSRDQNERLYVQDRLREAGPELRQWLDQGAVLYVCGSLEGMAAGVDAVLTDLLGEAGLHALIEQNRYRRDVY
ncbi:sulfite reductase flavoprotein subunit alpha [Herbaspirillum sp. CAH-3]|uniref:sulfite reductase flavoprotein subunit alpha n=1 Tax=Herbaspirillum sp. CAH-3 TaxID=2605746 RepID=UPI0012AC8640|nr:sulfite reductase flavoprotein subunit alpha [Herbaspirillum sp. CAH-3]MRT29496.1 nitric oxide synthase [Herbaspirillum sp. CAH-3]